MNIRLFFVTSAALLLLGTATIYSGGHSLILHTVSELTDANLVPGESDQQLDLFRSLTPCLARQNQLFEDIGIQKEESLNITAAQIRSIDSQCANNEDLQKIYEHADSPLLFARHLHYSLRKYAQCAANIPTNLQNEEFYRISQAVTLLKKLHTGELPQLHSLQLDLQKQIDEISEKNKQSFLHDLPSNKNKKTPCHLTGKRKKGRSKKTRKRYKVDPQKRFKKESEESAEKQPTYRTYKDGSRVTFENEKVVHIHDQQYDADIIIYKGEKLINIPQFSYENRVRVWFTDVELALETQGYNDPDKKLHLRESAPFVHGYTKGVDDHLSKCCNEESTVYNDQQGNPNKKTLKMKGEVLFRDSTTSIEGVFEYVIDPDTNICYHRNFNYWDA